jgi:hypothetical protein
MKSYLLETFFQAETQLKSFQQKEEPKMFSKSMFSWLILIPLLISSVSCDSQPQNVANTNLNAAPSPVAATANFELQSFLQRTGISNYRTEGVGGFPTNVEIKRTGRYVRIQLNGANYLSLAEVQVFGEVQSQPVNLAAGKPARQSTTNSGGEARRAVDGNTNGAWSINSVTHTDNELQAWWEVDLGSSQKIGKISVWNRTDPCCQDRLRDFYVLVSDTPFSNTSK